MSTMQIDILNPKAVKLLRDLADLDLIAIRNETDEDGFLDLVNKIREKAAADDISLEDIVSEVKSVRSERYARSKA